MGDCTRAFLPIYLRSTPVPVAAQAGVGLLDRDRCEQRIKGVRTDHRTEISSTAATQLIAVG